jgi:transcription initiation factor IIE alpha subunit
MSINDLSPTALKELEAKLEVDLVLVRKVLALLEDHARVAVVPTLPAAELVAATPPPRYPHPEEDVPAVVAQMTGTIRLQDVEEKLMEDRGVCFSAPEVRKVLNALVRRGVLAVVEARTGRSGSVYRKL